MNEPQVTPPIDPELEARVVALVLGEASDFERDQLGRLIGERPELAALRTKFEFVDGLLQDVGVGEPAEMDDDWKLPKHRRDALIAVLSGEAKEMPMRASVGLAKTGFRRWRWGALTPLMKIAASLAVMGGLGVVVLALMLPVTMSPRASRVASSRQSDRYLAEDTVMEGMASFESGDIPSMALIPMDEAETAQAPFQVEEESNVAYGVPRSGFAVDRRLSGEAYGRAKAERGKEILGAVKAPQETDFEAVPPVPALRNEVLGKGLSTKAEKKRSLVENAPSAAAVTALPDEPASAPPVPHFDMGGGGLGGGSMAGGTELNFRRQLGRSVADDKFAKGQVADDRFGQLWDFKQADDRPMMSGSGASLNRADASGEEVLSREAEELGELADAMLADANGLVAGEVVRGIRRQQAAVTQGLSEQDLALGVPESNVAEVWLDDGLQKEFDQAKSDRFYFYAEGREQAAGRNSTRAMLQAKLKAAPPVLAGLQEISAQEQAFSTFSLHVGDVSFKLALSALAGGQWPAADKVRIEEFVNAFDYGDPLPTADQRVACQIEQAIHPFMQQRNLLRVSMRTAAAGRASSTPLRLTLLLDNSGSMERFDRAQTVRRAFSTLAEQLGAIDQVTLISFARQPRLLADKLPGANASRLVEMIEQLPSEGGTNLEAALQLAFEKAQEQHVDGAQSRIILLTDGAVNLGDASPDRLSKMVVGMREAGIAFDAAGICAEGLNDEVLEALTRQGDGRYYLLSSWEDAEDGFAAQVAGALRPAAGNVKVQVEFNSKRVGRYKLLGFEKHRLKQEDFRNDKVDAAEMAAAEAGVAVYQVEPLPEGEGDLGSVSVRFRDFNTGEMVENRWPIPYQTDPPRAEEANASMRIATVAALFAAKLRGEPLGETVELKSLAKLIEALPEPVRKAKRIRELQTMIGQARQLSGQ